MLVGVVENNRAVPVLLGFADALRVTGRPSLECADDAVDQREFGINSVLGDDEMAHQRAAAT